MRNIFWAACAASIAVVPVFRKFNDKPTTLRHLSPDNPFSKPSVLPYQAPAFDKIHDSDYRPAFEEGIKDQLSEIQTIADNPEPPSFDNTLVALEKCGQLLARVNFSFNLVSSANTDPDLQKLQEDMAPKLSSLQSAMYLNSKLFQRVEAIYLIRGTLNLDQESKRLIEYYYQQFVLAGGKLSESDKATLKNYNEEEASLSAKFSNKLLGANKSGALIISDSTDLRGVSAEDLENYAVNARTANLPGKFLVPLRNTTQQPALQTMAVRATRQKLFEASWNRTEKSDSNDTRAIIIRIAAIRTKKAKLLGFKNFASWKLQDQMAQTPAAVSTFLDQLIPAITAKTKQEAGEIQTLIDEQHGGFQMKPWDWNFYSEQVRKAKYNVDEREIKPYFELYNVLQKGVFYAANQLYGLTFKERHDIPVYQKDVRVFEVYDNNQQPFALFYCDYFRRDNKSGGAWMSNLMGQSTLLGTQPVIYNICNFSKPAPGNPALISFDDVITMFHEFGHGLHGLFASQKYPSLSGTNVARDYVEFPSQFNEHWALDTKILKNYAIHYQTGALIPQALVDKMKKAATFNIGYGLTELFSASILDMQWHTLNPEDKQIEDADEFEKSALLSSGLDITDVPSRYRSSYFLHIWGNGYEAGYYSYQWTKMLAEDAFSWFEENGGLTRANGQRFRELILSRGNTEDYTVMFKRFRGHDPDIKAMQKGLGLSTK